MTVDLYAAYEQVTVRRIIFPDAPTVRLAPVTRMVIAPADQPSKGIKVPYAPVEVNHSLGSDYADVGRAGKKPALVYTNTKRREMSFTLLVADKYRATIGVPSSPTQIFNADAITRTLASWAEGGVRLRVTYGSFETNTWRISDFSIKSVKRSQQATNNFAVAELSMTFQEVVDVKVGTGPVSGGVKPSPSKSTPAPKTRTYTVKSGDTLYKISIKYYGSGTKWRKIADANKIKDPKKLRVGQKLKIP